MDLKESYQIPLNPIGSHWIPIDFKFNQVEPSVTKCSATNWHQVKPSAVQQTDTKWNQVQPSATKSKKVQPHSNHIATA